MNDVANHRTRLVDVQGRKFIMEKLNAVRSMKMQARILTVLGPVLGELANADGLAGDMSTEQRQAMGAKLIALTPKIDVDAVTDLVVEMCETCRYGDGPMQGNHLSFNDAFDDDLMPAYELVVEVAEFNFGKYFKAIVGNVSTPAGSTTS